MTKLNLGETPTELRQGLQWLAFQFDAHRALGQLRHTVWGETFTGFNATATVKLPATLTADVTPGVLADVANKRLTVETAGWYLTYFQCDSTASAFPTAAALVILRNGSAAGYANFTYRDASIVNAGAIAVVQLTARDTIEPYIWLAQTVNWVTYTIRLVVVRIA